MTLMWRKLAAILIGIVLLVLLITYGALRSSLPQIDGETVSSVSSRVSIERDVAGVATISAANRVDLAYATGYAHGQDRLFQMDLLRRVPAGELSELLGSGLIETDKDFRRHG